MQTYATHRKFFPPFHFVAIPLLIANFIYAAMQLRIGFDAPRVMAVLTAIALISLGFASRIMALRVQDRVIRLEMRMRLRELLPADQHHAILRLTHKQLVGLRFASDAELPALVHEVLKDNTMAPDAIKKQIKNWQADDLRA